MNKKAYFFIDDVIWLFRDITRQRPQSIFDHHLLKILKDAHDQYGLKVMLNCFYRTDFFYGDDEFTLADMTDTYKDQWENASDWLKFGFHSKQEFPDYPFINSDYDDLKNLYKRYEKEVIRFAGEKVLSTACNPHWLPVSKDGICALRDCGVKIFACTSGEKVAFNGDEDSLPFGHAARLLSNRKPETMLYTRQIGGADIASSICGYNHLMPEESAITRHTQKMHYDAETGVFMKVFCNNSILNLTPIDEIENVMSKALKDDYVCVATHEQYAYPEYYMYQPDTREKVFKMCEVFKKNNFEYIFIEELINQ